MAQIIGTRTTKQQIDPNLIVRDVFPDISLLEPDATPLITMLNRISGRKAKLSADKLEWIEDDYAARWGKNAGAASAIASTTVDVVDGTVFIPGDIFLSPNPNADSTLPIICRVTAVVANALTIVRNIGGVTDVAIPANGDLRLIGNAYEEGGAFPTVKQTTPVSKLNYPQIFRTATSFTNTSIAMEVYGKSKGDRTFEHRKKLIEHKEQINAALLWGQKSVSLTGGPTGKPIRTTDGINTIIQTNVTDAGGVLTRKKLEAFFRTGFRYGSKKKVFVVAPIIQAAIGEWAQNFLNVAPTETRWGMSITKIFTPFGQANMVHDFMLESPTAGGAGFGGWGFLLDLNELRYRYVSGNGENRDTKVMMDVIENGVDGKSDEIRTEVGFEIKMEKYHAKLSNVTDYMQ